MAKPKSVSGTTSDPTIPKVSVELSGKEYSLCFDFNAIAQAESLTGLNLLTALDLRSLNASMLRALLFAALLKLQPEMTLEQAGALITLTQASKVTAALVKAYSEAQPDTDISPNVQGAETA